jgi:hypothetical protein
MLNIVVDLEPLIAGITGGMVLAAEAALSVLPNQLEFIRAVWTEAVSGRVLPGMTKAVTDDRYAAALAGPGSLQYPFDGDEFAGAVVCVDGKLAMRIEDGYGSYDMKPGLLAGPAAKTSKDGHRYNTIPFTHSTPGTQGVKGASMPSDIYALAKGLGPGIALKLKGQMAGYGVRSKVPALVNAQAVARGLQGPMATPYTWRNSPYEGMRRIHKPGHSTYMTWRRVSDTSDPSSWIHPGAAPNRIIDAVGSFCAPIVLQNIQQAVLEALG